MLILRRMSEFRYEDSMQLSNLIVEIDNCLSNYYVKCENFYLGERVLARRMNGPEYQIIGKNELGGKFFFKAPENKKYFPETV